MSAHSIAEAEAQLSELIDRVLQGQDVVITRNGRPVVSLRPIAATATPRMTTAESLAWLRANRVETVAAGEDAASLVRRLRDEEQPL
jgi:prevent-host-death family protein